MWGGCTEVNFPKSPSKCVFDCVQNGWRADYFMKIQVQDGGDKSTAPGKATTMSTTTFGGEMQSSGKFELRNASIIPATSDSKASDSSSP